METIDLERILKERGLDTWDVATHLFPDNKYPRLALNRVLAGRAVLDANQISKLACLSGIPIADLFSRKGWKSKKEKGVFVFTNGYFKAELDLKTNMTKIFHRESILHDIVIHEGATPLDEYLEKLNSIIINHTKNENPEN